MPLLWRLAPFWAAIMHFDRGKPLFAEADPSHQGSSYPAWILAVLVLAAVIEAPPQLPCL